MANTWVSNWLLFLTCGMYVLSCHSVEEELVSVASRSSVRRMVPLPPPRGGLSQVSSVLPFFDHTVSVSLATQQPSGPESSISPSIAFGASTPRSFPYTRSLPNIIEGSSESGSTSTDGQLCVSQCGQDGSLRSISSDGPVMESPQQFLYRCIREKNVEGVIAALESGATIADNTVERLTPLMVASLEGDDASIINVMLAKLRLMPELCYITSSYNEDGNTALMLAAQQGKIAIVSALLVYESELNRCRRIINLRNSHGNTALIEAVINSHAPCVNLLMRYGADITIGSRDYSTPLQWACLHNNDTLVDIFIAAGADVLVRNRNKHNALHIAWSHRYKKLWMKLCMVALKQKLCCILSPKSSDPYSWPIVPLGAQ